MNTNSITSANREAAMGGLAVVGFIAVVGAGIWLALHSTRFVPTIVNNVGAAAVYLGSVFTPGPATGLTVVPTASTTIPFGEIATTTTPVATSTTSTPTGGTKPSTGGGKTPGTETNTTQPIGTTNGTVTPVLNGLPDLIVTVTSVGYLATASTDSFIAASTVPAGARPAISFTIKNIGTNVTGLWTFNATIPTQSSFLYQSQQQQSLNPGDSIDYVLGFDQSNRGSNQMITLTVNANNAVNESNKNNNSATASLTVLGN